MLARVQAASVGPRSRQRENERSGSNAADSATLWGWGEVYLYPLEAGPSETCDRVSEYFVFLGASL